MSDERLRVVDFSTHITGPHASQQLIQLLDANVIKVENPRSGDGNHLLEPLICGRGMYHVALNSGTRSLAFDRRKFIAEWPTLVEAAAKWADVVIVGGRPQAAKERGIDFESIKAINPNTVYCLLTGYGEDGPWAGFPAHGLNPEMFAGRVQPVVVDGKPVVQEGFRSAGTTLASLFGVAGILAALFRRDRGAGAQKVTSSIWGTALWWSWRDLTCLANTGEPWNAYDLGPRYSQYLTKDDRAILLAATERHFWASLCDVLDLPEEWKDRGDWSATGTDSGYEEEFDVIEERMRTKTLDEWLKLLGDADVPMAPALTLDEALNSDHSTVNQVMTTTTLHGEEVQIPATPVRITSGEQSNWRPEGLGSPPEIGEHTEEILAELGLPSSLLAGVTE